MNDANMLLRATQVTWIFECDPWVTCFKQHAQHFAPQVGGRQLFEVTNFTACRFFFVLGVGLLKCQTGQIVQIGDFFWRKQRPLTFFGNTFHEHVRNPVGCVHIMSTATVITGVFTHIEEFFDIDVPCF